MTDAYRGNRFTSYISTCGTCGRDGMCLARACECVDCVDGITPPEMVAAWTAGADERAVEWAIESVHSTLRQLRPEQVERVMTSVAISNIVKRMETR